MFDRVYLRILRQRWFAWKLALVRIDVQALFKRIEEERAVEREQWTASATSQKDAMRALEQDLLAQDNLVADLHEQLSTTEATASEQLQQQIRAFETMVTALEHTFDKALQRKLVSCTWLTWCRVVENSHKMRKRADEWCRAQEQIMLHEHFVAWKSCIGPRRRRLKLQRKWEMRRLERAVQHWHVLAALRCRLRASVRTIVDKCVRRRCNTLAHAWRQWLVFGVHQVWRSTHAQVEARYRRESAHGHDLLVASQKTMSDLRAKWGMSMVMWRLRCIQLQHTAWGFLRWKHAAVQQAWRAKMHFAVSQLDEAHRLLVEEQLAAMAQREEIVGPLRLTWQALSQAKSIEQLCSAVSSICLQDACGMLYLVDPVKQELWSYINHQMFTAPSHLGIAGFVVGSGAVFRSANVSLETRFHPLVDQFVVNPLVGTSPQTSSIVDRIQVICVPIQSNDGAVWGVVEMAFVTHRIEAFILCHACAAAVEGLLRDVLRSSRDPVAARSPSKLTKLFKQHKQWKKHYLDVEVRLRQAQATCEALERARMENEVQTEQFLKAKHDSLEEVIDRLRSQVAAKEQALLDEQQTRQAKEEELHRVIWTLQQHEQLTKARELLHSTRDNRPRHDLPQTSHLEADIQALENQLTRAVTDAIFLSKAIRVAMKYQGKLPDVMTAEVRRICHRLRDNDKEKTRAD
ncbi:hypothetical protein AC1031_015760 [Aphanomyces cochlioides]|nr:hypothetical protein AC1031_015760 [Aphanomyces cochlioides]